MSLPSEGLYSPVAQSETSESGLGIDAVPDHDNPPASTGLFISGLVEKQIRWIHFILGCSVLLSWNGAI